MIIAHEMHPGGGFISQRRAIEILQIVQFEGITPPPDT
jgi:hypothetical protein